MRKGGMIKKYWNGGRNNPYEGMLGSTEVGGYPTMFDLDRTNFGPASMGLAGSNNINTNNTLNTGNWYDDMFGDQSLTGRSTMMDLDAANYGPASQSLRSLGNTKSVGYTPTDLVASNYTGGADVGDSADTGGGTDWMNIAGTALSAAPLLYNLFQGSQKPQTLSASEFQNPYINEIRSTMRDRKFNIEPTLDANVGAYNQASSQLRNSGSISPGSYRSNLSTLLASRMRADAGARAQKSNVENQYLGEQAQMDAQLGQGIAATKLGVQDINDRNAAARRGMLGQGVSDVSKFAQLQQLMRNQGSADTDKLDILKTFSQYAPEWFSSYYNKR
jgi:hypothetical protein